jgi:hypothetical protein
MPVWVLTILKGIAVSKLRDWLAENALRWGAKILVKSTSNEWDDTIYDVATSIIDGEPTEEINAHMNKLVKMFDESSS